MAKNILSLNEVAAKNFFINHDIYSNMELPPYFSFEKTLSKINQIFGSRELLEKDLDKAKKYNTINHILYGNKNGKYAWRKYEIINPLIYLSLVNIITEKNNWIELKKRFKHFQKNKNIECESIPVINGHKISQKATQISHWVENIEKKSIYLSLEHKFLYHTDISDCYGSVYTHALPWAIHGKVLSKNKRRYNDLFGNKIDKHFQAMSFGQTNGIPQGSVLTDFIAEIVLGYVDSELSLKISNELKGKKYHVLRYRDDYRIFVNDSSDGDRILKYLGEILIDLGFRLNIEKTYISEDVISGSIKKDKFESLKFESVPRSLSKEELSKQLLIIQQISKQCPNSGSIKNRLSKIIDGVKLKDFYYQEEYIASLLADIAYNNPNTIPFAANLISSCVFKLSKERQKNIIKKTQKKICSLSNIGLLEIWMQRVCVGLKFKLKFKEKLYKIINNNNLKIFETRWISDVTIKKIIDNNLYINKNKLNNIKPRIENKEVQIFKSRYN